MDILNAKGKPLRVSASAVETFKDCKRKWAYSYILRLPQPKNAAAEVGNKVHDILENYLKTGKKPEDENNRYWRIAEAGLQFLPEVGSTGATGSWFIEEWVECQCGPLPFVGKIDLYNLEDFDRIQIDDHKTTGNRTWRWAKSPKQLAELVQPNAYAWALVKTLDLPIPESVDFRHIYYATTGAPISMEVRAERVPWSQVEKTWKELEVISESMAVLATTTDTPEEIEANTASCKKYGGCSYANICPASPLNRNKVVIEDVNIKGDKEMNDRLRALREQLLNNKSVPTPVPTAQKNIEVPVVQDPQGDAQALADKLSRALDGLGGRLAIAAAEAMARSAEVHLYEAMQIANLHNVNGFLVSKELSMTEADAVTAQATSPEQTDQDPVLEGWINYLAENNDRMSRKDAQAIVREATGAQRVRKERLLSYVQEFNETYPEYSLLLEGNVLSLVKGPEGQEVKGTTEVPNGFKNHFGIVVAEGYNGSAVDTYKKYRPESKVLAEAIEEVEAQVTASDSSEGGNPRHTKSSGTLPESGALPEPNETPLGRIVKEVATPTIYIDCIPEDPAGVYSFTDFVRQFEQEVEKEGGKVNNSFTQPLPYYGLLDYGQGPKRVAGKVLAALHRTGPQLFRGDMYVDGRHPLADEIIPILRRLKGVRVVRASR